MTNHSGGGTPSDEIKLKVGDQWFYKGNRSPAWFATYREGPSSIADRIEPHIWPILDALSAAQSALVELDKQVGKLTEELMLAESALAEKERETKSLRAFKRGVDEALNSGDGSYRP
jgi:hypothetical protein